MYLNSGREAQKLARAPCELTNGSVGHQGQTRGPIFLLQGRALEFLLFLFINPKLLIQGKMKCK